MHNHILETVCFSGHRRLQPPVQGSLFGGGGTGEFRQSVQDRVKDLCVRLYDEGKRCFLCGMAEGFDLLAGKVVAELKCVLPGMRLIAVIPFPGQAQGFSEGEKRLYDQVLIAADEKVTVCPSYTRDCFHRRNDYMVERSATLVCFFDGSPGGTAYTVKAAVRAGHRIYNLSDL